MERNDLEAAIVTLRQLLSADPDEGALQKWLEGNPVVFGVLNLLDPLPHPQLRDGDDARFIPDFVATSSDGLLEIVELKRPDTKVLKEGYSRQTFYALMHEYLAQCHEYSKHFDDPRNIDAFKSRYGRTAHKRPVVRLIAGMSEHLERARIAEMLNDHTPRVVFQTYDELLAICQRRYSQTAGKYEGLPGLTLAASVVLTPPDNNEYWIFDIGSQWDRNRVSLTYIMDSGLRFRILDSNGVERTSSVSIPQIAGRLTTIHLEVGTNSDRSVVLLYVDGRCVLEQCGLPVDFVLPPPDQIGAVIGSDMSGKGHSAMMWHRHLLVDSTINLVDRVNLRDWVLADSASQSGSIGTWVSFQGHSFLYTAGHPLFSHQDRTVPRLNLVQDDPARAPIQEGEHLGRPTQGCT